MFVLAAQLTFYLPFAGSLKDKRQVAQSLIQKARKRYNIAIAEVATQDLRQTLTLGLAVISGEHAHAQNMLQTVIQWLEDNTEAELTAVTYYMA